MAVNNDTITIDTSIQGGSAEFEEIVGGVV